MYFVDDEVGISAYLSTRFNEPCSPIRDVISIHNCVSMLHNFAIYYGVAKNRRLTTCCWFGRSTALSQIDDMVAENDKVVIRI